jgi:hypothetical protein
MTGDELRARLDGWGMTRAEAAEQLGLSLSGLWDQLRGINPVSRQTAIILEYRERDRLRSLTRPVEPAPRRPVPLETNGG